MTCTASPPRVADEEDRLVAAARDGDELAFGTLYRAHVEAVRRHVRARADVDAVEDLTAETFARAYGAIHRYELRGVPFRAWLYRIAGNLVIGRSRRMRTAETFVEGSAIERAADLTPDHSETVVEAEARAELVRRVGDLSRSHTRVLHLRYFEDLTVSETAHELGIDESAVRSLTYRALESLRVVYGC
jgi:RNA polymerase sigma-70 factor (ECF subfamily)